MVRFSKSLSTALCIYLLLALGSESIFAHRGAPPLQQPQQETDRASKQEKRERKRAQKADPSNKGQQQPGQSGTTQANGVASPAEEIEVVSDKQSRNGDLLVFEGYVNATLGDTRLQADRATYNSVTGDMVAEGNIIFDQGADQRVTARRAEINWNSRRGVFWDTTGFTNRTQTGEYLFFTAERVERTGPETYELFNASITACEDAVPKWSFGARRAELKMNDRVKLYNSVFRIKSLPAFVLPFAWIPATRTERKSGFLIPTTGTSNQKGRTFKFAYYQTLGQSADITFRNDVYTARGIGIGAELRARTDEKSDLRLGVFTVKDRLFGNPGEDQGGTAFVAGGVQYLPRGWLAVGNVSIVSSLRFRQVFSDDISQVIDPRRESTFYLNNNARNFSFNFLSSNETTRIFKPARDPQSGTDFDIKIRQAPQIDILLYPRRIFSHWPIYFSFDSSIGALKRQETVDDETVLVTPAAVQRFDFQPKIMVPLATFAGIAITPTLSLRQTFYTSSRDPRVPSFDPEMFTVNVGDPRLDPTRPEFDPDLRLFDRNALDPIKQESLSRRYAELAVDVRPPSLEKDFLNPDGSRRFKHIIEPQITYRLISGIGDEFSRIIRFDERDAVANTNEVEYRIINRFFTARRTSEFSRSRSRKRRDGSPSEMKPVRPDKDDNRKKKPGGTPVTQTPPSSVAEAGKPKLEKPKLETGEQAELARQGEPRRQKREPLSVGEIDDADEDDGAAVASNEDAPAQAYELLAVTVAQKYLFNRDFGGALAEGRRNQFYPINTLSGFPYGGHERSLSPVNVQVRYRPLSSMYADVRMDIGSKDRGVRNLAFSTGADTDKVSVSASWYVSRRIDLEPNRFEPGTFPGNQVVTTLRFGDEARGLYGGTRVGYDFTNRFITDEKISTGRLRNSRSYVGYQWDCCGVQFNYNTFKAGLRNESAFSFTFTLAGLGTFGTDQFSELTGGRGGRRRRRRARRDRDDDIP